jgi:uncharacterized membrane protein HdeD (DUF308 family)
LGVRARHNAALHYRKRNRTEIVMPALQPIDSGKSSLTQSLHDHWRLFLAEGIVLGVLGLAAIVVPPIAGLAATIFLGWLFLIAGIAGLGFTFRMRRLPGFGWSLVSAAAATIAGIVLLWNPLQGLVTLTVVLIAFFIIDGIVLIVLAVTHLRQLSGKWEWMMVNGVLDLFLAGIIIAGLPGTFVWAFGVIVGIDLMFGGLSLSAMALEAHKSGRQMGRG